MEDEVVGFNVIHSTNLFYFLNVCDVLPWGVGDLDMNPFGVHSIHLERGGEGL